MKQRLSTIGILATTLATSSFANSLVASEWPKIEQKADGQTVYFHAWGGSSQEITRHIQWAGKELKSRYNVTLKHIKVTDKTFEQVTQVLWAYLDKFPTVTWRGSQQLPGGTAETLQLLDDDQIDLAVTFNPNAVFSAQSSVKPAGTTKAYAMDARSLSHIHFLAIPWNTNTSADAQVAINFLLGPEAQSRKSTLNVWGGPSVLSSQYLTGSAKNTQKFKSIAESHPNWQSALEKEWLKRDGNE